MVSALQPGVQDDAAAAGSGHLCSVLFQHLNFIFPCNDPREYLRLVFPSVPARGIPLGSKGFWCPTDPGSTMGPAE